MCRVVEGVCTGVLGVLLVLGALLKLWGRWSRTKLAGIPRLCSDVLPS